MAYRYPKVSLIIRNPHGGDPHTLVLKACQPVIVTGIVP